MNIIILITTHAMHSSDLTYQKFDLKSDGDCLVNHNKYLKHFKIRINLRSEMY